MTTAELAAVVRARGSFSFARSGGPGGQNVNKVSSKVISGCRWTPSLSLAPPGGRWWSCAWHTASRSDREIVIAVQDTRDQARNREIAIDRMAELIARASVVPKGE